VIESSSDSEGGEDSTEENADAEKPYWDDVYKQLTDRQRFLEVLDNIFLMAFAWSFYYATQWLVVRWGKNNDHLVKSQKEVDGTFLDLIVAMTVSVMAGVSVFLLDESADRVRTSKDNENAKKEDESFLRSIIRGIAFLVGFAWEQSFDVTVGVVGEHLYGKVGKFGVFLGLVLVIAPAWIWYLVPMREEHGYRFGFTARRTSERVYRAFTEDDEYKDNLKRANEYAVLLSALAEAVPAELFNKMENEQLPIVKHHGDFFKAVKDQSRQAVEDKQRYSKRVDEECK